MFIANIETEKSPYRICHVFDVEHLSLTVSDFKDTT